MRHFRARGEHHECLILVSAQQSVCLPFYFEIIFISQFLSSSKRGCEYKKNNANENPGAKAAHVSGHAQILRFQWPSFQRHVVHWHQH